MESAEPQAVPSNQKSSSVSPLLVVLLCIVFLVVGGLLTYLLIKTNLTVPGGTEIRPTGVQNTPAEEDTFYVEYDYNVPDTYRIYFTTNLPENAIVNYESVGTTGGKTVIHFEGERLLEFTIPHVALPTKIDEYHEILNSLAGNLFRAKLDTDLGTVQVYSNNLYTEWGDDQCPQALVGSLPCAELVVSWAEQTSVEASFVGSDENLGVADEIMRSLNVISVNVPLGYDDIESDTIPQIPGKESFYIQFRANEPEYKHYFAANLPQNAAVSNENDDSGIGRTVINYEGNPLLEFSFPTMLLPVEVEQYQQVGDSTAGLLYRVKTRYQSPKPELYTNEIYFEKGQDKCPETVIANLPCAQATVSWEADKEAIIVAFLGDSSTAAIADEIVKSLEVLQRY